MVKKESKKGIKGTTIFIILAAIIILLDLTGNLNMALKFIGDHWWAGVALGMIFLFMLFKWASKIIDKIGSLIIKIFNK